MGEYADDVIEGRRCEVCGVPITEPNEGAPRKCWQCKKEYPDG